MVDGRMDQIRIHDRTYVAGVLRLFPNLGKSSTAAHVEIGFSTAFFT